MSLSSINPNSNNAYQQILQQRRQQELDAITQAVQAGDIGSAQKALTTLKSDNQSTQGTDAPDTSRKAYQAVSAFFLENETDTSNSVAPGSGDDFSKQIDTLFSAIAKGDLSGAQNAIASLQSQISAQLQTSITGTGNGDDAAANSLDTLFDAVKSGDASKAQSALQALESGGLSLDGTSDTQSAVDKDLQAVFAAVKSGDMKTAQTAMQTLDQDIDAQAFDATNQPPPPPLEAPDVDAGESQQVASGTPPKHGGHAHHAMFKDLSAVFDAVEKGDISAAQKSLSTWQSDKAEFEASKKSTNAAPQLPTASQAYFETLDG